MIQLKLGTRRSLLAWAQSSWVAREVERLNPGVQVELIGIDTRGDKIQDVPLQSVAGKEFFVAELDEALAASRVDFNVHSLKDLSLERPERFVNAAIPRRENPRDVVLFGPSVMEKLKAGRKLRIGTSSPRRLENIPPFLETVLPYGGRVELVEIRGNVNTRLSRVHEPESSAKHLDAVVLAFAGLIRLWRDEGGRKELEKLLAGVRWMVLPLKECPAAPGQGALAVECRRDDARTRGILAKLDHSGTASEVALERTLLSDWGGGCHQKFGATVVSTERLKDLFYIRGVKPDGEFVDELRWQAAESAAAGGEIWDGSHWKARTVECQVESPRFAQRGVFVANSRALPASWLEDLSGARIWTSGTSSWHKLAQQGIWVEGCAEGWGFESLEATLAEPVLQLPDLSAWIVLTHLQGKGGWKTGEVLATYELLPGYPSKVLEDLKRAQHVYWSSASQFHELRRFVSEVAIHSCGPGKTAEVLESAGIKPRVFPGAEEWRKWAIKS